MLATTLLLALCRAPASPEAAVIIDRVDVVEVNHFYDWEGRLVFDQLIFYDWDDLAGRYQVRAWRLVKCPTDRPTRDRRRGDWSAVFGDGELLRQVRARSYRETWTQHDPELLERAILPKDDRRELSRHQR